MNERDSPEPKIGAGHLSAMARLGLKELRSAAYFEGSNVAQPGELGLYGSLTPSEVSAGRVADSRDADVDKSSVLADRLRQAETRDDHGKDDLEYER